MFAFAVAEPECLRDNFAIVVTASSFNMTIQHTLALRFSGRCEQKIYEHKRKSVWKKYGIRSLT